MPSLGFYNEQDLAYLMLKESKQFELIDGNIYTGYDQVCLEMLGNMCKVVFKLQNKNVYESNEVRIFPNSNITVNVPKSFMKVEISYDTSI